MPRAYSLDLRTRVFKDCDAGMSSENAAKKYSVSVSWVYDLRKKYRATGRIAPKEYKRGARLKLAPYENEVRQLVADHSDATSEALHAMLPNQDKVTTMLPNTIVTTLPSNVKSGNSYKRHSR